MASKSKRKVIYLYGNISLDCGVVQQIVTDQTPVDFFLNKILSYLSVFVLLLYASIFCEKYKLNVSRVTQIVGKVANFFSKIATFVAPNFWLLKHTIY